MQELHLVSILVNTFSYFPAFFFFCCYLVFSHCSSNVCIYSIYRREKWHWASEPGCSTVWCAPTSQLSQRGAPNFKKGWYFSLMYRVKHVSLLLQIGCKQPRKTESRVSLVNHDSYITHVAWHHSAIFSRRDLTFHPTQPPCLVLFLSLEILKALV